MEGLGIDASLETTYTALLSVGIVLASIALALRFYTRIRIDKQLTLDDWFLVPAQILNVASAVVWMVVSKPQRDICYAASDGSNARCAMVRSERPFQGRTTNAPAAVSADPHNMHICQAVSEMRTGAFPRQAGTEDMAEMGRLCRHCSIHCRHRRGFYSHLSQMRLRYQQCPTRYHQAQRHQASRIYLDHHCSGCQQCFELGFRLDSYTDHLRAQTHEP